MKKLMIMAVAACAAVSAQATAWFAIKSSGSGTLYTGKGSTVLGDHSVYVLRYSETGTDATSKSTTIQHNIVNAFQEGTLSEDNIKSYKSDIASYQTELTTESNGRIDTAQAFSYSAGTVNTYYGFMLVAFNDSYVYVGDANMLMKGKINASMAKNSSDAMLCNFAGSTDIHAGTDGFSSSGWYAAVPEPTSGLLLLIGLAGIALKRKHA